METLVDNDHVLGAGGTRPVSYLSVNGGQPQDIDGEVVEESLVCLSVNGQEIAGMMCSPRDLERLAIGFLFNERLIESLDDVHHVHTTPTTNCVDVWLKDSSFTLPDRFIVTSGCGGGVTFDDLSQKHEPLSSSLSASSGQLAELMRGLHHGAALYQRARGIHTAVLATPEKILLQVEDVGRHNCLDKLQGAALFERVDTQDRILLSSGRISSEMLNKARRMGVPIVCSRTSPTSLSVDLATAWNMTLVAYLRQNRMRIYTHPERINL